MMEGKRSRHTGLEKLQVIRDLIVGEEGSVSVDLPDLGMRLVFIPTELCFLCPDVIWVGDLPKQKLEPKS